MPSAARIFSPFSEKKYTFGPGYGAGPEQRSADLTKLFQKASQ